ncbi:MAG TPA: replication-relaxation family protein [Solirubrobacterales bacterium]|nr:replication-relaxation family protein [Solirubrobacterales bacterium]
MNETASVVMPEATIEVIASLAEHRALSTAQVHAIHLPGRGLRRTQQLLADLERAASICHVEARSAPRRLWFLSERGADLLVGAGEVKERPKLLGPREAAGPLRAHTFAVNEVGISFLEAARERGDEFGPLSWRHEIAHPMSRGRGRSCRTLFADAVLTYLRLEEKHIAIEQRLVELDRATLSVDRLVSELARYAQLFRAADKKGEPLWRSRYAVFPRIICVLAGASRKALVRRREVALLLLGSDPYLSNAPAVEISFCLLDELKRRGPFAPIFHAVGDSERKVDWLGEDGDDAEPTRSEEVAR